MTASSARRPSTACSRNIVHASRSSRHEPKKFQIITGLNTLSSKLPCEPPKPIATSLPNTCTHTIVIASDCVGFTLPGMIDEPGSFSGRMSSPMPARGPDASQRTSLAIFISDAASVLSEPDAATTSSCDASAANLFGCERNGRPVSSAIRFAARSANSGCALSPVPTAVPPIARSYRSSSDWRQRARSRSSWLT